MQILWIQQLLEFILLQLLQHIKISILKPFHFNYGLKLSVKVPLSQSFKKSYEFWIYKSASSTLFSYALALFTLRKLYIVTFLFYKKNKKCTTIPLLLNK